MDEKQSLHMIQKYDFALYDLQLYLDTHPESQNALQLWNRYQNLRQQAVQTYTQRFGPLRPNQAGGSPWNWNQTPWPWEKEAN